LEKVFEQVWGKKNDFHYLCVDEKKKEVSITNEKRNEKRKKKD
jgi:hypothetical protein